MNSLSSANKLMAVTVQLQHDFGSASVGLCVSRFQCKEARCTYVRTYAVVYAVQLLVYRITQLSGSYIKQLLSILPASQYCPRLSVAIVQSIIVCGQCVALVMYGSDTRIDSEQLGSHLCVVIVCLILSSLAECMYMQLVAHRQLLCSFLWSFLLPQLLLQFVQYAVQFFV